MLVDVVVEYRLCRRNFIVPKAFVSDATTLISGSVDDAEENVDTNDNIEPYLLLYVDADTLVLCLR